MRRTTALMLGALVALAVAIAACKSQGGSAVEVVDEAYVEEHLKDAAIVDVRTRGEYEDGHIEGALNIDSATFSAEKLSDAGIAKDDPIILYCRSGRRADGVAQELVGEGYSDVKVYKPGYPEWSKSHS